VPEIFELAPLNAGVHESILLFNFPPDPETVGEVLERFLPKPVLLLRRPAAKSKFHQRVSGPENGMYLNDGG
jgi:hypothetical protein